MRELTLVMAHFNNHGMLAEQIRVWNAYPPELRAHLHVVVVDDHSPVAPDPETFTVSGLASFRVFRLRRHVRWNWLACRNLGAKVATTSWLLLTDMDHVLPVETWRWLADARLEPMRAYRFSRVDAVKPWPYALSECPAYKPHNDSWLITKALFDYDDGRQFVKGYDERLSGCYGSSSEFKDRLMRCAAGYELLTMPLVRYPREIIADASTHPSVYTRKHDPVNDAEIKARKLARSLIAHWRPLSGLIDADLIYDSRQVGVPC